MQLLHYDNIKLINISQKKYRRQPAKSLAFTFAFIQVNFIEMGIHPFILD